MKHILQVKQYNKTVKLGGLIQQVRGVSYKPDQVYEGMEPGTVGLLRANNIHDGTINLAEVIFVDKSAVAERQRLKENDILIATSSGSKSVVGKAARVLADSEYTFGAFCKVIRADESKLLPEYLAFFMQSSTYRQHIERVAGGANINNLRNEHFDDILIPLPPLPEQRRIAETLDRAQRLIDLRKKQIEEMDRLAQAVFIDTFGEQSKIKQVWPEKTLTSICSIITDGTHSSPKFISEGIPFLFVSNIRNYEIDFDTEKFISRTDYLTLIKRTPIEVGDILLTIVGSYGNPAVVRTTSEFCFQRHIAYIKPRKDVANGDFLCYALTSYSVKKQIDQKVKGIAQKTLNLSELKTIRIALPPLKLQTAFSKKVQAIEQQKSDLYASLSMLEQNFKSILRQNFAGG